MVGTRSGRRTSKNTSTMEEGQVVPARPDVPNENDMSINTAIYDLPSDSSNDTNFRDPKELHKDSVSSDPVQDTSRIQKTTGARRRKSRSFSVSSESSPKKTDRRRSKRFRTESDGALNLQEALKLPVTGPIVAHVATADMGAEKSIALLDRLQSCHSVDEMNVTPPGVSVPTNVLPNSAPAKTGGESSHTVKRRGNEQEPDSEAMLEGQPHERSLRPSPKNASTSREPAPSCTAAPVTPTAPRRTSPRSHTSAQGSEKSNRANRASASELKTTLARTPQSARSVRFGNESLNAVHIIPSVPTTLPFAEQLAKERESEALEASLHQNASERGEGDDCAENVVPKCGRIVIGQRFIAVDRFVRKDECKYHFLTHAHVDHFVNLNKSWKSPIYCSELTAKILPIMMGNRAVPARLLHPLEVGQTHVIEPNLQVTVLDANHCLGSVMFLFEGASIPGGAVLCTGDFRADNRLISRFDSDPSFAKLADTYISKIYLDNTHLDHSNQSFPDRMDAEKILIAEMEKLHECSVLIPVFKLGREEILERLSQTFSEVISTSAQRLSVRKACALKGGEFSEEDDSNARIRTSQRHPKQVLNALKKMPSPKVVVDLSVRDDYKGIVKEKVVSIPFSDHSSRTEIVTFLSRLRFGELIPTSAPMDSSTTLELMKLSRELCRPSSSCPNAAIQTASSCVPAQLGEKEVLTTPAPVLNFSMSPLPFTDMSVLQIESSTGVIDLKSFAPRPDPFCYKRPPPPTVKDILKISCDGNDE